MKSIFDGPKRLGETLCVLLLITAFFVMAGMTRAADDKGEFRLPSPKPKRVVENVAKGEGVRWNLALIKAEIAHLETKGEGARILVGDSGVDINHPELKDKIVEQRDFTGTGLRDENGHGTHVAGTIVGSVKMDGVAPKAGIYSAKVLAGPNGTGSFEWMARAIRWGLEKKVHVMNFSLGSGPDRADPRNRMPELRKALEDAVAAGVIVVIAAGNDDGVGGQDMGGYPARFAEIVEGLIIVAACDENSNIAQFSTRTRGNNVTAPGVNILGPLPDNKYGEWDGTSMAAPHVAGVAGLYVSSCLARNIKPNPKEFLELIKKTSITRNPTPPSIHSGYGLIQSDKFVKPSGNSEPPVQGKPFVAKITFGDLNEATRARLAKSGISQFELTIGHGAQWQQQYRPAPIVPASGGKSYSDCLTAVEYGRRVQLAVGIRGTAAEFYADSLTGIQPGLYECYRSGQKNVMQLITPGFPARSTPVYVPGPCPGGFCPIR
jgi:subtilisin family serine protease